jgi:hypothetical protein
MHAGPMVDRRDPEWVTWPEAAEIVGCPVSTIDWHTRTGRIQKRPRHGARPSLNRTSVEDFAKWWRQRQTARGRQRAATAERTNASPRTFTPRRRRPRADKRQSRSPVFEGWLTAQHAAEILGASPATAVRLAQHGAYPAVLHRGRWRIDPPGLDAVAADRSRWVSHVEAGRLAGCAANTIGHAVQRGLIVQRTVTNRALPSLDRASVLSFAEALTAERAARVVSLPVRRTGPPDDGHVWLDTSTTALLLDISRTRVGQLARSGRLPGTVIGGRRWFRRSHVEQVAAARAFRRRAAG